jgi:ACR3 family arsenite efflux pump ArsB
MKKSKRILAIIGIVMLVGLYVVSLISAIFATEASATLFKVSIFCTIVIPLLLYAYMMLCRVFRKKDDNNDIN